MKRTSISVSAVIIILTVAALFRVASAQQADTIPPSTPDTISASLQQSGQIYVSWNPSTDNVGVSGYYLYRNGGFVATIPGYTYYTDNTGPGVFSYTVSAYDTSGNISAPTNATTPITVIGDYQAPSAPTNLTASVSSSSITLAWDSSTDDVGVIGYYLSRNGFRIQTPTTITGTNYTDTGLSPGVTYRYTLVAYDAAGNNSNATAIQVATIYDITPPSVPSNVTATSTAPTTVTLKWQPATDNISVDGYTIYRDGALLTTVPSSTAPTYDDTGVSPQTAYTYTIAAYDEVGNLSATSNPLGITTPAPDLTAPTMPTAFTATALSASDIALSWRPSTDNMGVTGYTIYRDGQEIGTVTTSSYLDTGLTTSTSYLYYVDAFDAAGNLSAKNGVSVITLSSSPATITPPAGTTSQNMPASNIPINVLPIVPIAPTQTNVTTPTSMPTLVPAATIFNINLYYGLRNANVVALQSFLIQNGYLAQGLATGFFGTLTQKAVQNFQCAQNVVCSGTPASTGWGNAGPRTRSAINSLQH
jgi:chitodextrinase